MIRGALLTLPLLALAVAFSPGSAYAQEASADTVALESQPPRQRSRPRQVDSLILDVTAITGNRELPKVLHIVPWKDSDFGDLTGRPVNSLLDEVLSPVDRDVFLRQMMYFEQLYGSAETPPTE
jgi:hypothetical protein